MIKRYDRECTVCGAPITVEDIAASSRTLCCDNCARTTGIIPRAMLDVNVNAKLPDRTVQVQFHRNMISGTYETSYTLWLMSGRPTGCLDMATALAILRAALVAIGVDSKYAVVGFGRNQFDVRPF